jgi:hypothetical protein
MSIAWQGQRTDVIDALRTLSTLKPAETDRDPEFTQAVHALVDDTWWEHQDPSGYVGLVLVDQAEADAARAAVAALVTVLDALGPEAEYDEYLSHPGWPQVTTTSAALLERMTATG